MQVDGGVEVELHLLTSATDGVNGQFHTPDDLHPVKRALEHTEEDAGLAPEDLDALTHTRNQITNPQLSIPHPRHYNNLSQLLLTI
jgi:7,8-dihydro-6-hydroxymethylpterin-pyrophosphokinase